MKLCNFLQLRTEVNRVLEFARTEKLIGSSLEAKVYIHTLDADLAERLRQMSETANDADSLHRIFITSQVSLHRLLHFRRSRIRICSSYFDDKQNCQILLIL